MVDGESKIENESKRMSKSQGSSGVARLMRTSNRLFLRRRNLLKLIAFSRMRLVHREEAQPIAVGAIGTKSNGGII